MRKIFRSKIFKLRIAGNLHKDVKYQCPVCKRWFCSSNNNGYNQIGVRLHVSKLAKIEIFRKGLKEINNAPHFDFYKSNTYLSQENSKRLYYEL